MKSKKVNKLFNDISKNMLQYFGGSDYNIPHTGEKGGLRERRVKDFLEKSLPYKYGISTGHIIDKNDHMSLQEDIVIYDKINSPILMLDDYYQLFPCESVIATIEVKSNLGIKEIKQYIKHKNEIGKLDRSDHRGDLGKIQTYIFAYNSYKSNKKKPPVWVCDKFKELTDSENTIDNLPEAIVCLKNDYIIKRECQGEYQIYLHKSGGALLDFLSILMHRISIARTKEPLLYSKYGWLKGDIKSCDKNGNINEIIGFGFGSFNKKSR